MVEAEPQNSQLRYALARLLAAADDPALRDPSRALRIAADLMLQQPIPPHQRLLALAQAADGRFDDAIEGARRLLAMPDWMLPAPAGIRRGSRRGVRWMRTRKGASSSDLARR